MKINLSIIAVLLGVLGISPAYGQAGSFWEGFTNGTFNTSLWNVDSGRNGSPFGCTFYNILSPGSGGGMSLNLWNGACAELSSKSLYQYGTIQTDMTMSNVAGTVGSLFVYDSWYKTAGHPWQEIDIEFLPSKGNLLHTNVIYQSSPSGTYTQYELYVSLANFNINPMTGFVQVGFDWAPNFITWFVYDSAGVRHNVRTVTNSSATNCDCIPPSNWPTNPTTIFYNYWEGDNSSSAINYFPGQYYYGTGTATYKWIQYIKQF